VIPSRNAASIRSVAPATMTAVLLLLCSGVPASAGAQQDTTTRGAPPEIAPVRVQISRDAARSVLELPFAIARVTPDSLRPQVRRNTVGALLFAVPGVQVQTRNNPTQDARIAVRGFGARSPFGVRGVKVLRDGIPLSLPDGQTPMDWLDLETVGSVEAIRGTAAALYGNAAGGVLDFRTRDVAARPVAPVINTWDGGGARRVQVMGSGTWARGASEQLARSATAPTWLASITHTRSNGPRVYAEQRTTSLFAQTSATIGRTRLRLMASGFDMPLAQNPGALTAEQLEQSVRLADSANIARGANKTVRHGQVGIVAEQGTAARGIEAAAWLGARDLDNPLTFAVITIDRRNAGLWVRGTSTYDVAGRAVRLTAGLDVQAVRDDRANLNNCVGRTVSDACPVANSDRGALRLDQREEVQSEGAFVRYEMALSPTLDVSAALRWDQIRFQLQDRFVTATDLDDSGEQSQSALNPMLGLTWRVRPALSVYANLNTAFETPTVTELTTQTDGTGGLNASLSPQRTRTLETGVRGVLGTRTWLDVALFSASGRDELIPFDVPGVPGRRTFRNAGRTTRQGVEASVRTLVGSGDVGMAYTGSRFRFDDYEVDGTRFDGNRIPGIPTHQLQAWTTVRRGEWFATVDVSAASAAAVNDANDAESDGWMAVGVRVGGERGVRVGDWSVAPVIGVENLFDARYSSAILINASRGRFFEPAPPRTLFAGMRILLR
jgi:iron complex outermembrane receptor protein